MALNIPPRGDSFRRAGAHFANLEVSPQDTPDMTVKTTAGGFWDDNTTYVEHAGGTSPTLTAPSTNAKLTVIALNLSGALVLIDGAEAASPDLPAIPSDRIPLAVVLLNTTDTTIDDSMVFDLRPVLQIGADINNLTVTEVVGLDAQLALKADITALNNGLAAKADIDGTACSLFKLNANHTGAPTADGIFRVERGNQSDVELRWNETSEVWEFTNDGTNFSPIGNASSLLASAGANASAIVVLEASVTAINASVAQNASVIGVHTTELASASGNIVALQASTVAIDASIVNINASLVDLHASVDQNASVIAVLVAASTHPLNLTAFRAGTLTGDSLFWIWPVAVPTSIVVQAVAGTAQAGVGGAGATSDIALKHAASVGLAGSSIGTVSFAASVGTQAGTVNITASTLVNPGTVLRASVETTPDATIADIAFTITATKTTT